MSQFPLSGALQRLPTVARINSNSKRGLQLSQSGPCLPSTHALSPQRDPNKCSFRPWNHCTFPPQDLCTCWSRCSGIFSDGKTASFSSVTFRVRVAVPSTQSGAASPTHPGYMPALFSAGHSPLSLLIYMICFLPYFPLTPAPRQWNVVYSSSDISSRWFARQKHLIKEELRARLPRPGGVSLGGTSSGKRSLISAGQGPAPGAWGFLPRTRHGSGRSPRPMSPALEARGGGRALTQ